ncbi:very short patch repair endonuclease [Chryseobacterium sp. R2A-55]|nr:very short patch repair endonuclease [Chryseobacterium sp. R2A-55]
MDNLTQELRRKSLQANRSKGTTIKVLLGKALFAKGLRCRKNNRKIPG